MAKSTLELTSGKIVFVDSHLPPLQAGEYEVTIRQEVRSAGGDNTISERYVHTRHIAVQGKRFALAEGEIDALFPPKGSEGKYDNVLPHVVFKRRTLPWERSPDGTEKPWLALLVFHASDDPPAVKSVQVGDLRRENFPHAAGAAASASSLPATAVSYQDGFNTLPQDGSGARPKFELEFGEGLHDGCTVIDVPIDLFNAIAPSLEDLPWLAHARTVRTDDRTGIQTSDTADYSVVVANRLPDPREACTVHLVSLEGLGKFLPAARTYAPATILLPDGRSAAQSIRLITLKSWSFSSKDPSQNFDGLLQKLDIGPLQLRPEGARGAQAGVREEIVNAFNMGYTALNHQTRLGDATVSWYRGPLVPFKVPPTIFIPLPEVRGGQIVEPIQTADRVLRYDPEAGMFDVTYAAAWEIGRVLALQDKNFSVTLYNWKRANARATALAAEQQIIEQKFGDLLQVSAGELRTEGAAALQKAAASFITTSLKPHLVPADRSVEEIEEENR